MQVISTTEPADKIKTDAVVVGVYLDNSLVEGARQIDNATGGMIQRLLELKEFKPKIGSTLPLHLPPGVASPLVMLVGLGSRDAVSCGACFQSAGAAAKSLSGKSRENVAFYLDPTWSQPLLAAAVSGAVVGCQGQDIYRAKKKLFPFEEALWSFENEKALRDGQALGMSINLTRRLVNEPAQELHPVSFANRAQSVASEAGMNFEVWDEKRLEDEKCGALLAVSRGSVRPPRLIIMRHQGAHSKDAPWLAIVGKGVTFDSGGLSLKPTDSMKTMKMDMAGAATVVGAMQAIATLHIPANVIGLAGLVENMTGAEAYKLGDVLTARNGRTIEVLNTDAEGRLVLADVLSVAIDMGADKIVDLATLTGACIVALGMDVAGLMTNDQPWCDVIQSAADACGEKVWQLPMFEEYGEQIKADVADIKNIGDGRWGGAITAAKFLEEFVDNKPWTHIDIAGPAFLEKPKPWLDAGGTGVMVRTLVEVARKWAE